MKKYSKKRKKLIKKLLQFKEYKELDVIFYPGYCKDVFHQTDFKKLKRQFLKIGGILF